MEIAHETEGNIDHRLDDTYERNGPFAFRLVTTDDNSRHQVGCDSAHERSHPHNFCIPVLISSVIYTAIATRSLVSVNFNINV